MLITNQYDQVKKDDYKYIFYLNNRDYIENKRDFVIELSFLIERFSRNLETNGLVVKTYDADIEKARKDILAKPWSPFRLKQISKTPGILMIDTEFKSFDPNKNNWLYFYFIRDQRFKDSFNNSYTIEEAEKLFDRLADIITKTDCNIFKEVKKLTLKNNLKNAGKKVIDEYVNYTIGLSADKFFNIINKIWIEKLS